MSGNTKAKKDKIHSDYASGHSHLAFLPKNIFKIT